ncbi:MAG: DUF47 family protein [Acidimicrobiia bacterium]
MRFRLVPRDEGFYPLFNQAAENVAECARRMQELLSDFSDAAEKQRLVNECEQRGDELTRTILGRLNTSFVTPFDREDIHELTEKLDDVVDEITAAGDLLVLHNIQKPLPEMEELAALLVQAADTTVTMIAKLPRLRGLDDDLEAVNQIESAADKVYRRSLARLFSSGEYKAFDVLRWKDVVEAIERSVNEIENISDIVESIVLKHA